MSFPSDMSRQLRQFMGGGDERASLALWDGRFTGDQALTACRAAIERDRPARSGLGSPGARLTGETQ